MTHSFTKSGWQREEESPSDRMNCPTCGKPADWQDNQFRPFCSERCKLVDLGRWMSDEYRMPGIPIPPEQREDPSTPTDPHEDN